MKFSFKFSHLCGTVHKCGNVLFTPDGNSLLSPVGNRITVFDLINHTSLTLPFENRKNIAIMALSNDGRILISVDEDGHALLINLLRRIVLHHFNFKSRVYSLQFSPDDRFVAVSTGRHVQVWRAPGLRREFSPFVLHHTYTGHYDDVVSIQWSRDSRFMLTGSRDMTCRIFALHPIPGFVPITLSGHRDAVVAAFFTHDDRTISPPHALLRRPLHKVTVAHARSLTPSHIVTVARDGAVFVWKWQEHPATAAPARALRAAAAAVARHRTKRLRAAAASGEGGAEADGDEASDSAEDVTAEAVALAEAATGGEWCMLLTQGCWAISSKHFVQPGHSKIMCATYFRKGNLLVVGFSNGVFGLYEMPDCNAIHTLSISQRRVTTVAVNATGEWLAFGAAALGQLLVWEWQSETYVLKQQGHMYDLNTVAFSPDGRLVATGGDDGKVKLWNASSGFCFVTFAEHTGPVTAVAFVGSGHALLTASLDGTVRAWDLLRYRNFRVMTSPKPVQFVSLAVDPAGEVVAAGCMDPFDIYVWSLQTGRLLEVLSGHEGPVSGLCFSPSDPVLASSSWDKTVRLWNVYGGSATATEVLKHTSDVLALAIRPDGEQLCSSTLDGYLHFWDMHTGAETHMIDGKRDVAGGRRTTDLVTAASSARSKHFSSVCYTADGTCVLAGGNSRYVCLYQAAQRLLVKKFQVSHNRSLEGIVDKLHSGDMTEAGPRQGIDADSDSEDERRRASLPGATRGDMSSRRALPEIRTKCVQFAPTGRGWAAASTEGLLIYSLDDFVMFNPFELDESVTPDAAREASLAGEHARALLMALHLNEADLVHAVLQAVPAPDIAMVASAVPTVYLPRLLTLLAGLLASTPHVEFYLRWCCALLHEHGALVQERVNELLPALRAVHKSVATHAADLSRTAQDNLYSLRLVAEFGKAAEGSEAAEDAEAAAPLPAHSEAAAASPAPSDMDEGFGFAEDWAAPTAAAPSAPLPMPSFFQ